MLSRIQDQDHSGRAKVFSVVAHTSIKLLTKSGCRIFISGSDKKQKGHSLLRSLDKHSDWPLKILFYLINEANAEMSLINWKIN